MQFRFENAPISMSAPLTVPDAAQAAPYPKDAGLLAKLMFHYLVRTEELSFHRSACELDNPDLLTDRRFKGRDTLWHVLDFNFVEALVDSIDLRCQVPFHAVHLRFHSSNPLRTVFPRRRSVG